MKSRVDLNNDPLLRAAAPGRAVLRLTQTPNGDVLLKNYSANGRLFRSTCGAYMASREAAAYRRLTGIAGVPRLLRRVGSDGLSLQYIAGNNCLEPTNQPVNPEFFEQLREILSAIRARGVLHGDVKRNVVVSVEGKPVVVDFGASFIIRWWLWPIKPWLISLAARYDDRAVAKLKRLSAPQLLTAEDQRRLAAELPFQAIVKRGERLLKQLYRRRGG